MRILLQFTLLLNILFTFNVTATNYYCDPVNGSMRNSGTSQNNAWTTFADVAGKAFKAGDIIYLMNGAHDRAYIATSNTGYVTVKALDGHSPKLGGILFGKASYWAFEGLTFTADGSGGFYQSNLFNTGKNCNNVKITNCTFYMGEDSSSWTYNDWYSNTRNIGGIENNGSDALKIDCDGFIFNNNLVKNVYFALRFESSNNVIIKDNLIDNFGADGIQMYNTSNVLIENNVIRDAYIENYAGEQYNHDDAIQIFAWNTDPDVNNIVIKNNQIFNFKDPITQGMIDDNLVSYNMQGIINTDGIIENSLIENNLIVSDHYHALTLLGPNNCRVQNNTVSITPTSINPTANVVPWVQIAKNKSGVVPSSNIIRNNLSSKFTPWTYDENINTTENNIEVSSSLVSSFYSDYSNFDFTLRFGSPAIEYGVNTDLSETDLAGNKRLFGSNVDCGAYEYGSSLSNLEFETSNSFKVYPSKINNGIITIESNENLLGKELKLKLVSIEGKFIFTKKIRVSSSKITINIEEVNSCNSNIFILKISTSDLSETHKLIK